MQHLSSNVLLSRCKDLLLSSLYSYCPAVIIFIFKTYLVWQVSRIYKYVVS